MKFAARPTYNGANILNEDEINALLANYALTGHHHDATYGRLAEANTWTQANRFDNTVQISRGDSSVRSSITAGSITGLSIEAFNADNSVKHPIVLNAWGGKVAVNTTTPGGIFTIGNTGTGDYAFHAVVDSTGRGLQLVTQDYVNGSAGSALTAMLANGTGNAHAILQAYKNGKANAGDLILQLYGGNLGLGTAPYSGYQLDATSGIRARGSIAAKASGTYGLVELVTGSSTLAGYIQWRLPAADGTAGSRLGYMGWHATNLVLTLESSANFVVSGGKLGVGATSPQGNVHSWDGTGAVLHRTVTGLGGAEVEIIPDGTGDVAGASRIAYVVVGSDGTKEAGDLSLYNTGADTTALTTYLMFTLYATGKLTVARRSGTATYRVSLLALWT